MKTPTTIMLVEDHPEYREVIEMTLAKESDLDLVSQFGTVERALRSLQDHNGPLKPQIVLLDLNLPGMSGTEAIPWFKEYSPKTQIIVLTQSDAEADVLKAIQHGASGYLLKSSTADQIKAGIRTVMNGGASLDARVASFILDNLRTQKPRKAIAPPLSKRELEILSLLGDGMVKKEIANHLDIGYTTVDTHVGHIYQKLEVRNAPAAVNRAHRLGLFPHSPS